MNRVPRWRHWRQPVVVHYLCSALQRDANSQMPAASGQDHSSIERVGKERWVGGHGHKKAPHYLRGFQSTFAKATADAIKDRQRLTLPGVILVPSALAGLTALFGMGRGDPRRYSHLKILKC